MNSESLGKMTVADLKEYLKLRALPVSGSKRELINRVLDSQLEIQPIISLPLVKKIEATKTTDAEFSNFIKKEFADYKLSPETANPCVSGVRKNTTIRKILDHQKFLIDYFQMHTAKGNTFMDSRGLLLYHSLGSGKSSSAVLMARAALTTKGPNSPNKILVLIPASLKDSLWVPELVLGFPQATTQAQLSKIGINIVHYNAPNMEEQLRAIGKGDNPFDDTVVIIDEVHNILNTLVSSEKSSRHYLYELMMAAKNAKFILLSGTPIANEPFEICFAANILRGREIFNVREGINRFNSIYFIDNKLFQKERFLKKIQGLVSYYSGISEEVFPTVVQKVIAVNMSGPQWSLQQKIYKAEDFESARETSGVSGSSIEDQIASLSRARALNVRGNLRKILTVTSGSTDDGSDTINMFVFSRQNSNFSYPPEIYEKYQRTGAQKLGRKHDERSAQTDSSFIVDSAKFEQIKNEIVLTPENLKIYSPKMKRILESILKSEGPCVVYSNFEGAYGISIFAEILKQNNIKHAVWSGKTTQDDRTSILRQFNSDSNINGDEIKVLCLTSSGKEGISLRGVRQVHIVEPWWNYNQTLQVIGRAVRICSHYHLPKNQQKVEVFRYVSIPSTDTPKIHDKNGAVIIPAEAIEMRVAKVGKKKMEKGGAILELLKQGSVDCLINQSRTHVEYCSNFTGSDMTDALTFNDSVSNYDRKTFENQEFFISPANQVYTLEEHPVYVGMAELNLADGSITKIIKQEGTYTTVEIDGVKFLERGGKLFKYMTKEHIEMGLDPVPVSEL